METTKSIPKESPEPINLTKNEAPPSLTVKEELSQKEGAPSEAATESEEVSSQAVIESEEVLSQALRERVELLLQALRESEDKPSDAAPLIAKDEPSEKEGAPSRAITEREEVLPQAVTVSENKPSDAPASSELQLDVPFIKSLNEDFVIHVANLTKKFGEFTAVKEVSFKVPRGSIFGFIGPSGCGKTTTVRLMSGLYVPSSGDVVVLGRKPVDFTAETRAKIGYMPQLFALYPDLSIWENMNFTASLYGISFGRKRKERFNELLDFVELSEHKKKLAKKISGGMKRRLTLAATLIHDPELIFMDEPTAGIDPVLRRKFWDHFKGLHQQGRTLFITTQYVGEAAYCDYVGVMVDGRLLMVLPPEELRRSAFGGEVVHLSLTEAIRFKNHIQPLQDLPFVKENQVTRLFRDEKSLQIVVDDASTAILKLIEWSKANDITIETIEQYLPPFDDVFVEIVQKERSRE